MPGTDNQEAVTTSEPLLSIPSSLDFKSDEQSEVLLCSNNKEKNSVSAENSQGVSKQSTIRPALLPRSRFQKPKPNIGRAVGRKEVQSLEGNETTETVTAVEKSELKKSERIGIPIRFTKPSQSLPAEVLEKKSVDNEKTILEDSQVLITSHNISDQRLRENPILQERKQSIIKPAQLVRGRFQRARPSLGRIHDKKQRTLSENTNGPVKKEVGKYSMEIFKTSDLDPPSKDEVIVQASLDNLGGKEDSESCEGTLSKRCIGQKLPSPENLQECVVLIPEGEAGLSKDEGKHLDIPESDKSVPQEISQLKNTKPAQPGRRHLQKPKPNVTRASEKKDAISSEDISLEDMAERGTENDTTLCGSISGEISTLIHISQTLVEAASVTKSPKEKTRADGVETVSLKTSGHSGRSDSSEQPSKSENQTKKEVSKPLYVQERHFKGKQPVRTLKQKKNYGDSRTFFTSECEDDSSKKRKHHPKNKAHVNRGKSLKTSLRKKPRKECGSAKVSLVTLRASSQEEEEEDDDDGDDFEPDYELECFSPEEVNKAPVFVPRGLRSPNPVPVQIEETMEELEIYENVADELCLPYEVPPDAQTMIQEEQLCSSQVFIEEEQKENTGIIYGSTEAAMTLLAMRDPVFQLNIVTQENQQEHAIKDELSATDSLHTEPNEAEKAFPCNELCSTASKIELVSSMSVNRSTTEDYSTESPGTDNRSQEEVNVPLPTSSKNELVPSYQTKGLGECSQETSTASSDSPVSKGNKTTTLARCRFPKPKPNLNRCLGLRRKVPPKSLGLLSVEEQFNVKNDNKVSGSSTEEWKVQLQQNLKSIEVVQNSSEEKHDFQPGNGDSAIQKTNMERKDLAKETWEVPWESTTPEAETRFQELPRTCNTNMDAQISTLAGHEISTVDESQIEALKQSSISVTKEITAVSSSMKEYPTTEEEPTFILTLVEIPADSEDCGGGPVLLQQTPAELLPAPLLFTPANTDTVELTREDSTGFIPTAEEGNAACINSSTESKELHTLSSERLTDSGSISWNNLKNSPEALEGSCDLNGKEGFASSDGEDLKSSIKEISPKLQCIPEEADEEDSEKLNVLKKKNASTSESVPELYVKEKEQPLSFPNLAVHLEEADRSDEQMSRMLYVGKTEKVEEQRNIVDTCKSIQPEQGGHTRALPKAQLSWSNQKIPGFLPLMCKDNDDEEITTKLHKELLQEAEIIASKSTTKSPVSSRDNKEEAQENISLPSAIPGSSTSEKGSFYNTQVSSGLSDSESSSKEQEKEEEPTRISEYFFSDIFMEVEDSE